LSHNTQLDIRSWQGTPISRRTTDGFVNATAMCKANGKAWADYWRTDRATKYLEALSTVMGFPITGHDGLVVSISGGTDQGTWVHERVAVDLARWLSPQFAVWMDGWFLEQVSQVRDTQPVLAPTVLDTVDRSIQLLERLGGIDDRAQMLLRDVVLNTTMKAAGGTAPELEPAKELTISEYLIELKCPSHKATPIATKIGKEVKRMYYSQNGRDPKSQDQLVNGRRCGVALYEKDWLERHESNFREAIEHYLELI
jgi:hypothetical protein